MDNHDGTTKTEHSTIPQEIKLTLEIPPENTHDKDPRFSLTSILEYITKRYWVLAIFALVFFTLSFGFAYWNETNNIPHTGRARTLIAFTFPNAELGLDPLGRPLNVHAITQPHVIAKALDELDLRSRGISPEDIRSNLVVEAVNPHDAISRITQLQDFLRPGERLLELIDDVAFHPTQFVLTLYRRGNLSGLSNNEMSQFLDSLLAHYLEFFIAEYNELSFVDVVVGHVDPKDHDFFELINILDITIRNMQGHLTRLSNQFPDFRSPNTSRTFSEIFANLEILRTVELMGINATISFNHLSRDAQRAADILEMTIIQLALDEQVLRQNAETAIRIATDVYEPQTWIFGSENYVHEFFRNDSIYNDLLMRAQNNIQRANQMAADMVIHQNTINMLRQETPPDPAIIATVENQISILFDNIAHIEDITNQTIQDLLVYDLFRDAVRTLAPPAFTSNNSINTTFVILVGLIGGILGLFIGLVVLVYRHVFHVTHQ